MYYCVSVLREGPLPENLSFTLARRIGERSCSSRVIDVLCLDLREFYFDTLQEVFDFMKRECVYASWE